MKRQNIILLSIVILLMFVPLFMNSMADFKGADDQTTEMISKVNPDYQPWFSSLFEPSEDVQPWIFGLQAGLGAGTVAYILGYLRGLSGEMGAKS